LLFVQVLPEAVRQGKALAAQAGAFAVLASLQLLQVWCKQPAALAFTLRTAEVVLVCAAAAGDELAPSCVLLFTTQAADACCVEQVVSFCGCEDLAEQHALALQPLLCCAALSTCDWPLQELVLLQLCGRGCCDQQQLVHRVEHINLGPLPHL
jgi:hypothetical protein